MKIFYRVIVSIIICIVITALALGISAIAIWSADHMLVGVTVFIVVLSALIYAVLWIDDMHR